MTKTEKYLPTCLLHSDSRDYIREEVQKCLPQSLPGLHLLRVYYVLKGKAYSCAKYLKTTFLVQVLMNVQKTGQNLCVTP